MRSSRSRRRVLHALCLTLAKLSAQAKARPETLHFGAAGVGSSVHMVGERYKTASQASIVHIPYRDSSAAINDLLGGQIQLLFENVPTTAETGLTVASWTTLAASKDVPDALIEKISADQHRVYADPAFRAGLERLGMTPMGNSPAEARAFVERERARWNKVIEAEHINAG